MNKNKNKTKNALTIITWNHWDCTTIIAIIIIIIIIIIIMWHN